MKYTSGNCSLLENKGELDDAIPIELVCESDWAAWRSETESFANRWIDSIQFFPKQNEICLLPNERGRLERVLVGVGPKIDFWSLAELPFKLPQGIYALESGLESSSALGSIALGWALGAYRFEGYKSSDRRPAELIVGNDDCLRTARRLANSVFLVRDLINCPANDLGPSELAGAAEEVGVVGGADVTVISGTKLIEAGFPTIHAVGRASTRDPCIIDLQWGSPKSPRVTLIGKGVCFDTGGLNLKPADNMLLMKKDMGGAAHVLALAKLIMEVELDIRLRVLIPAVENSVSGDAFRPGDVLKTGSGRTVEIGNTDAEGRLILCDALTVASQEAPDLMIDFATLTGAARVALGTEVAAMFTDDEELATELSQQSFLQQDPLWRLPLWKGYTDDLASPIADYNNVSPHRYGGAISAALFLQKFVAAQVSWVHFDIMGWNRNNRPGRPVGGEAFALRALAAVLLKRYGTTS